MSVVLLDLDMPEFDGYGGGADQALVGTRSSLVEMTSRDRKDMIKQASEAGGDALIKPIDPSVFVRHPSQRDRIDRCHEVAACATYGIDVAVDGAEALRMVQSHCYDILMDMQMPVMDGVSATREIRRLALPTRVSTLAMTVSVMQEHRQRCVECK